MSSITSLGKRAPFASLILAFLGPRNGGGRPQGEFYDQCTAAIRLSIHGRLTNRRDLEAAVPDLPPPHLSQLGMSIQTVEILGSLAASPSP
ncbi:hypothetical protein BO85DRAFT_133594 [Aspergillus piperis CBS 112811]|uniref:Uncharacterized protein n=1 Tax=Aspergillus piperis CBS 112811 TaxID=1448313 RepID=A0A8G1RBY4_9EURO|nr:hypothetical protein BO85DRAFT_133594 [Aspergillus piperis CBS 112811]RAH62386.1 hypothetical protein BO85DRAFT_133594 [Aspergillus piperis CBS 112811]